MADSGFKLRKINQGGNHEINYGVIKKSVNRKSRKK